MSAPAIRVKNLSKQYQIGAVEQHTTFREAISGFVTSPLRRLRQLSGKHREEDTIWALKDVSFDVQPGEVVGVIGRNGAGKSTLLKVLSQITEPTDGWVEINGRVGRLLEVGTGFHPELTGRENVFLSGAILGMSRREIKRKFDEIVAFAEIDRFVDTPVKRYSSGMYMRLAFAVAAHLDPEILIVDEVLAVGDSAFQQKCLGKIGDVAQGGRTVMFVSHNMAVISQLCQRAILLHAGAIADEGSSAAVIHSYLSRVGSDTLACPAYCPITPQQHDPRFGGTSRVELRAIRLLQNKLSSFTVYWQEPIAVELEFEAKSQIRNAYLAVGVKKNDGSEIFGTQSHERDQALFDFEPGIHKVVAQIENPLLAGRYCLSVSSGSAVGNGAFMSVPSALFFEVLATSLNGDAHPQYRFGTINGRSNWFEAEPVTADK